MGAILDTANTLLEFVRDCVADCSVYSRQFVYIGNPVIDCDTLAVSVGDSDVLSVTNECSIHSTQFTITLARCCWPGVGEQGEPPTVEAINAAVACLLSDAELVLCCLGTISLEGNGVIGRCRPKVKNTRVKNPTGKCASYDIVMTIETKPCCSEE